MKSTRIPTVLLAALLVVAGCAGGTTPTSQSDGATSGGSLTWGWHLPSTWDPVTSTVGQDVHVLTLAYAALTKQDVDGNAVPALAESWAYNDTGDEVTFTLRPDLSFTDGSPLDAEAVKSSLLRDGDAPDSTIGAQLSVVTDIRVDSPTEVTLLLNQPDYQIPLLLAGKTGMIVSPTAVETDVEGLATKPVGAGPFALDEYVPSSHATLHKFEDYWDAGEHPRRRLRAASRRTPPSPSPACSPPYPAARTVLSAVPDLVLVTLADGRHDAFNDRSHRTAAAHVVLFLEDLRAGAAVARSPAASTRT